MSLVEHSRNALLTGDGSDFSIFVFDGEGVKHEKKVHKFIIRQSLFLKAMLDMRGKEAVEGCVTIHNIPKATLELVLQYLYTEELPAITAEEAIDLLAAADYLQLDDLKTIAVDEWKHLVINATDSSETIEQFRMFVERSRMQADPTWWDVMELVLPEILTDSFNIGEESSAFIEFVVKYWGNTHPYLSTELLSEWTLAADLELTDAEKKERKELAAKLIKKINLQQLTLRSIALLSASEAFPADYMLQQMQMKAKSDGGHESLSREVIYLITTAQNRTVELEFETGIVVFQCKYFALGKRKKDVDIWRFLKGHNPWESIVRIPAVGKNAETLYWTANYKSGSLTAESKKISVLNAQKKIAMKVQLKRKAESSGSENEEHKVITRSYDF